MNIHWVLFWFVIAASIASFILAFFSRFCDGGTTAAGAAEGEENAAANEVSIVIESPPPKAKQHDKQLEGLVYTTDTVGSPSDGGCAICLDEYGEGEPRATIVACSHRFHALCIEAWLRNNETCPLCRHLLV